MAWIMCFKNTAETDIMGNTISTRPNLASRNKTFFSWGLEPQEV